MTQCTTYHGLPLQCLCLGYHGADGHMTRAKLTFHVAAKREDTPTAYEHGCVGGAHCHVNHTVLSQFSDRRRHHLIRDTCLGEESECPSSMVDPPHPRHMWYYIGFHMCRGVCVETTTTNNTHTRNGETNVRVPAFTWLTSFLSCIRKVTRSFKPSLLYWLLSNRKRVTEIRKSMRCR